MDLTFASLQDAFKEGRRRVDQFLWHQNPAVLPRWRRFIVRSSQITVAVIRDLLQEQLSLRAMSLVFTTLIGFFPLLALTFAVLKSLGVHNDMETTLLTLLDPLGGGRAQDVTTQILSYVDNMQVELIGITSIGLLFYIVLDMMRKIEAAFNYIWDVKRPRSWSSRISEYLFAVIVSPLLLFISISITSYVNTNFFEAFLQNLAFGGLIIEFTATVAPVLLMSLAFAFAYSFLPNIEVNFSSAFIGGLVTTIIWKIMGSLFQEFFVSSARESIYLAFASAIIVLFFIYIGWLVALIGSSIAFYHQYPAKTRTGRDKLQLSINQHEALSLAVADAIIERFHQGRYPLNEEEIMNQLGSNPLAIDRALGNLQEIGLITTTADDVPGYLPTRSVTNCTIVEVWKAIRASNADIMSTGGSCREMERVKHFQDLLDSTIERELGDIRFTDDLAAKEQPDEDDEEDEEDESYDDDGVDEALEQATGFKARK